MQDKIYVSLTLPNIITIWICGLLGYGLLKLASAAYGKMTGAS